MTLLKVENLSKDFDGLNAVTDVSFDINEKQVLALVGESGCGKSTLGRMLVSLIEPTSGSIMLNGKKNLTPKERAKAVQIVFQDPYGSLNPRMTARAIVEEPLRIHRLSRAGCADRLAEAVGLSPNELDRYPHQFSGGQRQRIALARALALSPSLIVADEPTSALDVSIQSQILTLLSDLRDKRGVSFLFISHDLAVVEHFADRVAVMYLGRIVETTDKKTFFSAPKHPYSRALLDSVPTLGTGKKKRGRILRGESASPLDPPSGCAFHPRCDRAKERCKREIPVLIDGAACHFPLGAEGTS